MGWWRSEHGSIGDSVADIMDAALRRVYDCYLAEAGRPPLQGEMADLVEFCTGGQLVPECGNVKAPFAARPDRDTPRARPNGRQGVFGDASVEAGPGLRNVNPATGERLVEQDTPREGDDWLGTE